MEAARRSKAAKRKAKQNGGLFGRHNKAAKRKGQLEASATQQSTAAQHRAAAQQSEQLNVAERVTRQGTTSAASAVDANNHLLRIAARDGSLAEVTTLIEAGADVDKANTNGATPLYIAAQNGHLTVVTKLITAGADVNKARTTDGCTPLYSAASKGHTAIVSKLLQHGADKSIRGWQNKTPLEAAQGQNHAAVVALLA